MGMLLRRHNIPTDSMTTTQQVEITSKPVVSVVEEVEEVVENTTKTFTKTEINRMSKEDLIKLATDNDIDASEMSGADIKKALIDKLGL